MKILSTLVLAGALAASVPGAALAGGRKLVVTRPQGSMQLQLTADGVNINAPIPVYKGRIELQEGPYEPGVGKQFMLTKLIIGIQPFILNNAAWGRIDFNEVGVHLRDALVYWAQPAGNPHTMGGVYKFSIPPDAIYKFGDPTLKATGLVFHKGEASLQREYDRVSEPITGTIDLDHGTIALRIVLEGSTPAPWWQPWADGIQRKFTFTLTGKLPGPVNEQVDPEEPRPPRPLLVPSDPLLD